MATRRLPDPGHFEALAELYDRARPAYPPELWTRLRELGVLRAGSRVLDVGAGSGQASDPLLAAGARVTALEPGPRLAALLRTRLPGVDVVVGSAEETDLPAAAYDAVVCATSFHWLDPVRALPRLRGALREEGRLVCCWQCFGDPRAPRSDFRDEVERIVAERGGQDTRAGRPSLIDVDAWGPLVAGTGDFDVVHTEVLGWSVDLTARQVGDLFATFSDWEEHEVARARGWVALHGGRVREHYATSLVVATPTRRDVVGGPCHHPRGL